MEDFGGGTLRVRSGWTLKRLIPVTEKHWFVLESLFLRKSLSIVSSVAAVYTMIVVYF